MKGIDPGVVEGRNIVGNVVNATTNLFDAGDKVVRNVGEGNYGTAALEAMRFLPGARVSTGVGKQAAKYLTQGPLKNAYKLNPYAFKANPEMYVYRARPVGQNPDMNMAATLKAKEAAGEPLNWMQKNIIKMSEGTVPDMGGVAAREKYYGRWFDKDPKNLDYYINPDTRNFADNDAIEILRSKLPRAEADKLKVSQFEDAKSLSGFPERELILPKDLVNSAERFPESFWQQLIQEDKAFNTPHWYKGYKKVSTELPGSPNAIETPLGFQNRVFDTNVQLGEFQGKGHLSEKGYNYRTLGNEEIKAIQESKGVFPKKGKTKGGNENVKYWTKGNEKNWYAENPNQQVVRIKDNKFSTDKVAGANDVEIYNHETGAFEPIINKSANKSFMGKVKDYFDRPPGPLMLGMSKGAVFNKEIKNPDYFLDLMKINKYSPKNKKYFEDLIANVKRQGNVASEKQYEELQRLKTGDMNYGKKGYAKGGIVSELSKKEIKDLVAQGYIVEDVD
jgi:hypothetical protein